jgi:ABC-type glycerol-3-phosphate transport system substrate-binding protein
VPVGIRKILCLFVGSLWLVGCQEKASDGRVHITYWEKWSGFEAEAMQRTVDQFNRSQNKIVVEYLPLSNVDRKTLIATAGGDPPDVVGLWAFNVCRPQRLAAT